VDAPEPPKPTTPEQLEALLRAGSRRPAGKAPASGGPSYWKRRQLVVSALILLGGLLYALTRTANAPARVTIVNNSGADAVSVTIVSGGQRIELGEMLNGSLQQAKVTPGEPLQVAYDFGTPKVWRAPTPLTAFEEVTVTLAPGGEVQMARESPWKK
jgi:hypothetical protein